MSLLFVVLSLIAHETKADDFNTRILLHDQHTVAESNFGVAGWVIAPNITSSASTWLTIAGPRYDGKGWNVELLGGTVISDGEGKFLLDTRLELTPKFGDVPIYSWHNLQWINTGGSGTVYWYSQVDWVIPLGLGLLGIETENTFNTSNDNWSIAPHIALPLGNHITVVVAPQVHFNGDAEYAEFQFWTRLVLNL